MQAAVFSAPGVVRMVGLLGSDSVPVARFLTAGRLLPEAVEALATIGRQDGITEPIVPVPQLEAA